MEGKWEYLSDSPPWGYGGRWKKFEMNLSNIFEGCFMNGVSFVSFTRNGNKYNACLHRMEQYLVNGNEYTTQNEMDLHSKIRRVSIYYTNNSFKLWNVKPIALNNLVNIYELKKQFKNRSYLFSDVSRDNQEFEFASLYFNRFLNADRDQKKSREIIQVDCIIYGNGRHPVVEQYKELKKNFSFDGKGVKEIFVFHGTDDSSIKKIINEGFKVGGSDGIPIKNGRQFGAGVYTSSIAHSAVQFGRESKKVILAKGLVGNSSSLLPRYGTGKSPLHDSWTPMEQESWVVFKEGQQLIPLYVIHFQEDFP